MFPTGYSPWRSSHVFSSCLPYPSAPAGICLGQRLLIYSFAVLQTQGDGRWDPGDLQEVRGFRAVHLEFTGVSEANCGSAWVVAV